MTEALLDHAVGCLRDLGAVVVDPVDLPDIEKVTEPEFEALNFEFKHGINTYLKYLSDFADGSEPGLPGYARRPDRVQRQARGAGTRPLRPGDLPRGGVDQRQTSPIRCTWSTAGAATQLARTAVETPVVEHRLDAIFSLTANPAWLTDYVLGDHSVFGTSRPGAVSGWPRSACRSATCAVFPVGVSFLGPRLSEPRLLALAYAFEQATTAGAPPSSSAPSLPPLTPQLLPPAPAPRTPQAPPAIPGSR